MSDSSTSSKGGGNNIPPPSKKIQISPAKKWCFTWNNYGEDWSSSIVPKFQSLKAMYGMQPEVGSSGTPHIQGWVEFPTKLRPLSLGLPQMHWEKMKGSIDDNIEYCSKSDTKSGDYITNKKMKRELPIVELTGWQVMADMKLNDEPNKREIFWIWSKSGSKGKSTFVRHLVQNRNALICAGKAADMKHQIVRFIEKHDDYPDIVVFDCPRSMKDYLSYTGIEEIKNGVFASSKYESDMVVMPYAHVIVLANFPPDLNNEVMSEDRFVVWDVEN